MIKKIDTDEDHQYSKRILGVRDPQLEFEAANKRYVDLQIDELIESGAVGGGYANALMLMGG